MSTLQQTIQPGWNIAGHEHAIGLLRRILAVQQVRHAYLFTGPDHIGKALLAHRFAQTLLCTGGPDPQVAPEAPCNACLSCRKVLHGNHPDLHVIARPPDKQFIVIEQIRSLQSDSARKTMEGRRNVFIIQDAHDMNLQAANCLLKTLEDQNLTSSSCSPPPILAYYYQPFFPVYSKSPCICSLLRKSKLPWKK
ncbi:MAG: hypothetical protein E6I91_04895, partial [Chloroflexi bacterium]